MVRYQNLSFDVLLLYNHIKLYLIFIFLRYFIRDINFSYV